ncbi:MAG: hypothetical protein FWD16_01115, partial [Clostridia bacterium]|nr:hypothetical protein [Clostridia bacterium]
MKKSFVLLAAFVMALAAVVGAHALERTVGVPVVRLVAESQFDTNYLSVAENTTVFGYAHYPDGTRIAVGSTDGLTESGKRTAGNADTSAIVVKHDIKGEIVFTKLFGGAGTDVFDGAAVCADGGFLAWGFTTNGTGGDYNEKTPGRPVVRYAIMAKFDAEGALKWSTTFNRLFRISVVRQSDEGILVVGNVLTGTGTGYSGLFRLDSGGKALGEMISLEDRGTSDDYLPAKDGGYVSVGSAAVRRYNAQGNYISQFDFAKDTDTSGCTLAITSDGGFIVSGLFKNAGDDAFDFAADGVTFGGSGVFTVKFDSGGKITGGFVIEASDSNRHMRLMSPLADGGALVEFHPGLNIDYKPASFIDPITGENHQPDKDYTFIYHVDGQGLARSAYKIEKTVLYGLDGKLEGVLTLSDSAFRVVTVDALLASRLKVKVFELVNKTLLQKAIDATRALDNIRFDKEVTMNLDIYLKRANDQ